MVLVHPSESMLINSSQLNLGYWDTQRLDYDWVMSDELYGALFFS